jgi:hypothetical protein
LAFYTVVQEAGKSVGRPGVTGHASCNDRSEGGVARSSHSVTVGPSSWGRGRDAARNRAKQNTVAKKAHTQSIVAITRRCSIARALTQIPSPVESRKRRLNPLYTGFSAYLRAPRNRRSNQSFRKHVQRQVTSVLLRDSFPQFLPVGPASNLCSPLPRGQFMRPSMRSAAFTPLDRTKGQLDCNSRGRP